jgi:hypothetical protein
MTAASDTAVASLPEHIPTQLCLAGRWWPTSDGGTFAVTNPSTVAVGAARARLCGDIPPLRGMGRQDQRRYRPDGRVLRNIQSCCPRTDSPDDVRRWTI